jgi:hypothetical protein
MFVLIVFLNIELLNVLKSNHHNQALRINMKLWNIVKAWVMGFWIGCGVVTIYIFLKAYFTKNKQAIIIDRFGEAHIEFVMIIVSLILSIIYVTHFLKIHWEKRG